jgi:hypothetical protein
MCVIKASKSGRRWQYDMMTIRRPPQEEEEGETRGGYSCSSWQQRRRRLLHRQQQRRWQWRWRTNGFRSSSTFERVFCAYSVVSFIAVTVLTLIFVNFDLKSAFTVNTSAMPLHTHTHTCTAMCVVSACSHNNRVYCPPSSTSCWLAGWLRGWLRGWAGRLAGLEAGWLRGWAGRVLVWRLTRRGPSAPCAGSPAS